MAIFTDANQYKHSGKGPLDSKALVKSYSELLLADTWTVDGKFAAYNGMITAVWLNKDDTSKNGIYFLQDPTVTSALKSPDVTNPANWHKLGGLSDLPGLNEQLPELRSAVEALQADVDDLQDAANFVADTKEMFPEVGQPGKLYIATTEATTYIWLKDNYIPVGDGQGSGDFDVQIIMGGGPTA